MSKFDSEADFILSLIYIEANFNKYIFNCQVTFFDAALKKEPRFNYVLLSSKRKLFLKLENLTSYHSLTQTLLMLDLVILLPGKKS